MSGVPTGWTVHPDEMLERVFWGNRRGNLKDILKEDYDLHDAKPVWARPAQFGGVAFVFEASPGGNTDRRFYAWEGMERKVLGLKRKWTRDELKNHINASGGGEGNLRAEDVELLWPKRG